MSLAHVGALIEADNRARIQAETFGHLAPENSRTYSGTILFAHSAYGDGTVPITAEFADLPDSPWFYEGMCDFLLGHHSRDREGKVFRWTGTYELRMWPDVWDDDESDLIQQAGHEHVFAGDCTEIQTAMEQN